MLKAFFDEHVEADADPQHIFFKCDQLSISKRKGVISFSWDGPNEGATVLTRSGDSHRQDDGYIKLTDDGWGDPILDKNGNLIEAD